MITLTKSAADHALTILNQRGQGLGLRIDITPSGCNGFKYLLEFVDTAQEQDLVYQSQGVKIYIDPQIAPMIQDLIVDWQQQGLNEKFEFINPNETSRCGCGQSFGI